MKTYQFIIILILLNIFSSQTSDTCPSSFDSTLNQVCKNIDAKCSNDKYGCHRRGCSNGDENTCSSTLPNDDEIHTHECVWKQNDEGVYGCRSQKKTCSRYNYFLGRYKENFGDICSSLDPGDSDKTCALRADRSGGCQAYYSGCSKLSTQSACENTDFVKDFHIKCRWNVNPPNSACVEDGKKLCTFMNDYSTYDLPNTNENKCSNFATNIDKTKCIYFKGRCIVAKESCGDYSDTDDGVSCRTFNPSPVSISSAIRYYNMPLNDNKDDFNYSKKCVWDKSAERCKDEDIICSDYDRNEEMCENMPKCVYESNKCIEKYDDCSSYNSENGKDRTKCENSLLIKEDKKCDYILGTDECKTKKTYQTCKEYNDEEGHKDSLICESIRTSNPPYYCVLDKDNQCIERELNCSEVYNNREDCIHIAKASDPNKKCAHDSSISSGLPKCKEEYIRCEDYTGTDSTECENIILYNGLQCEYESNRCRSRNKICIEAETKEECKLISKTGVTNPDRKVCDYINGNCTETFKYCSDYRGIDSTDCHNIKPYNPSGENIDVLSKCKIDSGRCQRIPKDCSDADDNPILCEAISPYIKDNTTMYCRYDRHKDSTTKNKCIKDYKTCESYKETTTNDDLTDKNNKESICVAIIPEHYENGLCKYEKDKADDIYKCVQDKECNKFNSKPEIHREICNKHINPECLYDSNSEKKCGEIERNCNEIRFYNEESATEEYCNKIEASKPYKKCSLKEDKSGCEEKYIELDFSTAASSYKNPPGSENVESTEMVRGIHLIMILLCLLL